MAWQWSVASRMARRSGGGVLSPVSLTSMLGIILGVTSLIVVLSITEGFESAFEDRILGFHPHVVVLDGPSRQFVTYREASEQIRSVSDVEEVSPSTFNEMLLAGKSGRVGVSVKGLPLTGLKNLLDSGVEWEGELNLLDATLGAELKDGEWSYTNPVAGTSWTVLHAEDQTPVVIRAPSARPAPGRAHLRVIQWDGSKGMWCTVDGDEVWVPAAQEGASRSVEVTPGSSRVRCGRSGEGFRVEIAEGESLLVSPGTSFPPVEDLLKSGAAQTENTALVRVVKWNDSTWVAQPFQPIDARLPGILVGKECFEKLQLERGAVVTLASPLRGLSDGGLAPFGMVPKGHAFQVAGWFSSGYHEYDSRMAVLSLETAQETLGVGDSVIWLDVRFADPGNLERKTQEIRAALEPYDLGEFVSHAMGLYRELQSLSGEGGLALAGGGEEFTSLSQAVILSQIGKTRDLKFGVRQRYKLISWEEMNANLFGALKLQKVVLTVFFLIIIAVAAFNVVGSQVMQIHDKRASIAILKAMGAPQQGIRLVFLIQGAAVSAIGTFVGVVLGLGLCFLVEAVGYPLDPEVYLISSLPVSLDPLLSIGIGLMAILLTTMTTVYSANRAARMAPVSGLRHLD